MIRVAWRSVWAHKLRTLFTMLAILLGVAMISGTFVLTDQIDRGFKQILSSAYEGVDVTVAQKTAFTDQMGGAATGLPESMVGTVKSVDGVAKTTGYVAAVGAVAVKGEVVATGGAPTLFFSCSADDLTPPEYIQGAPPSQRGEVGIIERLATGQKLSVGSPITVITAERAEQARVSGVFRYAEQSSLGGSLIVYSTLDDAQSWFGMSGRVSGIDAQATPGVPAKELAKRIRGALPADVEVKTGEQTAADQTKLISDAVGTFLTPALLSFGGIAILVGAFIIFNAFSMTVAQRRRELGMLRALGASRRQVLGSIAGEALLMGAFASLLGLFAGLGVAAAVNSAFKQFGMDIPQSGLVMELRTVVVAFAVGIVVTLLSALVPAVRATRVPPIAALQEGTEPPRSRYAWLTPYAAAAVAALGALGIVGGMYGPGTTAQRLGVIAAGAVLVFIAVAMVSKYLVPPLVGLLGWPLQAFSPVSGRLARDNSRRNPARTAATASALMIGLGVVVFVAVVAQGMKSSFIDTFDRTVRADYLIVGSTNMPLPAELLMRVRSVSDVQEAVTLDAQEVQVKGGDISIIWGIDQHALSRLWQFEWLEGPGDRALTALGADDAILEEQTAKSLAVGVGDALKVTTADGKRAELRVRGIYRDPMMLDGIAVGKEGYAALFSRAVPMMIIADRVPAAGVDETKAAITAALEDVPSVTVQTGAEFKETVVGKLSQILNLLYGLLALSVIISVFGIVNTLVLSVYERTREIGLLRAIGMSRRQVRSIVRYESVITSIIGSLLGIAVGILFAWVVTTRFAGQGITFSIPGVQLVVFLVIGILVGVIAAILPARRAVRIDILDAIHYE